MVCRSCHGGMGQRRWNRNIIGGGLAREAAKQPIFRAKHLRAKVKNWGGAKAPLAPPGSAALASNLPWVSLGLLLYLVAFAMATLCLLPPLI